MIHDSGACVSSFSGRTARPVLRASAGHDCRCLQLPLGRLLPVAFVSWSERRAGPDARQVAVSRVRGLRMIRSCHRCVGGALCPRRGLRRLARLVVVAVVVVDAARFLLAFVARPTRLWSQWAGAGRGRHQGRCGAGQLVPWRRQRRRSDTERAPTLFSSLGSHRLWPTRTQPHTE